MANYKLCAKCGKKTKLEFEKCPYCMSRDFIDPAQKKNEEDKQAAALMPSPTQAKETHTEKPVPTAKPEEAETAMPPKPQEKPTRVQGATKKMPPRRPSQARPREDGEFTHTHSPAPQAETKTVKPRDIADDINLDDLKADDIPDEYKMNDVPVEDYSEDPYYDDDFYDIEDDDDDDETDDGVQTEQEVMETEDYGYDDPYYDEEPEPEPTPTSTPAPSQPQRTGGKYGNVVVTDSSYEEYGDEEDYYEDDEYEDISEEQPQEYADEEYEDYYEDPEENEYEEYYEGNRKRRPEPQQRQTTGGRRNSGLTGPSGRKEPPAAAGRNRRIPKPEEYEEIQELDESGEQYEPNGDGYYDDRLPQIIDEITKTSHLDVYLKITLAVIILVATIVYCIYYVQI